ncbi:MAG: Crp/Fnr family transcriptional regulator, partial [Bdellovibrionaceae bacterium]|nr:Crp/Fnr family transcriptional regulator [Pseudobdellovibrionaceae bacterium]
YFGHRALFSNDTYHANAVALEPTEVAFIDRETVYENLRKDPEVAINIIQVLARQLRQAEERLAAVTDKDVRARVAEALIYLKERYPEHRWTRKEIADFCSSTTATVIKTLAQFEDEGLIAQDGRNIQILKRSHLLAMSN